MNRKRSRSRWAEILGHDTEISGHVGPKYPQAMINLGNYSIKLATAMLQMTPADQLTEEATAKAQSSGPTEALQRLERELAATQAYTRLLEEGYGPSSLQLEIIKNHIGTCLLENAAVVRWLAKKHPEYLQQLQRIADIKELAPQ